LCLVLVLQGEMVMRDRELDLSLVAFIVDGVALTIVFVLTHWMVFRDLTPSLPYVKLQILVYVVWFFVSMWFRKWSVRHYRDLRYMAGLLFKTTVAQIYLAAIVIVMVGAPSINRFLFFGMFFVFGLTELALLWLTRKYFPAPEPVVNPKSVPVTNISLRLALLDFLLVSLAFVIVNRLHHRAWLPAEKEMIIYFALVGSWMFVAGWTTKFDFRHYSNIYHAIWPVMLSAVIIAGWMSVLIFALGLFDLSRWLVFGSIGLWLGLSLLLTSVLFLAGRKVDEEDDDLTLAQVQVALKQEELPIKWFSSNHYSTCMDEMEAVLEKEYPEVLNMIRSKVIVNGIDRSEFKIMNTHTPFNIDVIPDNFQRLFMNLHRVNDFRRLNRYFLQVHRKLENGGYFISCKEPIEHHRQRFFNKYPEKMAMVLYTLHFIFVRIWPKLPVLKRIYFAFTRGRNRVISRAELFGRLSFCGFRVIDCRLLKNNHYFIAQKVKTPSRDLEPSYGPLIKLKKIGYKGQLIQLYKLRTMHAYSEYIQDYVFEQNSLHDSGKFQDDYRITEWGHLMRALWLDELPQLYNIVRGDINLIGVRALSRHYFSLYPADVQKLRVQFKPGLIPPYYADMPKSFEEIVESERTYLLKKQERPVRTDLEYAWKAFHNIVFKGARSR